MNITNLFLFRNSLPKQEPNVRSTALELLNRVGLKPASKQLAIRTFEEN